MNHSSDDSSSQFQEAMRGLASDTDETRWLAVERLRDLKSFADAPDLYFQMLNDPYWKVRGAALHSLQDLLHDVKMSGADVALESFEWLQSAVERVSAFLRDSEVTVRVAAANTLGLLAPSSSVAVGNLIAALDDQTRLYPTDFTQLDPSELATRVCTEAAWALGELGERADVAVPALMKLATNTDSFVRSAAETALARIERAK